MGLFDQLGGSSILGNILGQAGQATLPVILGQVFGGGQDGGRDGAQGGGLSNILVQLQKAGLGDQVSSWLGQGQNMPITADQLRGALDNEQVRQLAAKFGIDPDAVLKVLADYLPPTVDAASPEGTLAGTE